MLYFLTLLYTMLLLVRPQEFVPALQQLPLAQLVVLIALPAVALVGKRDISAEKQQRNAAVMMLGAIIYGAVLIYTVIGLVTPIDETQPAVPRSPLQVALFSALGFWLLLKDKGWEMPQFRLFGPFLLVTAIGMGINGWWGGGVYLLQNVLPPILTAVLLSGAIRSLKQLRVYLLVLIIIACVIVLHGHWQMRDGIGWSGTVPIDGRITYSGIFEDPNDLGLLLIIAIGSICYLYGACRARLTRWLLLAAAGWLLYGVMLTDSRGTMLAVLALLTFHLWKRFGKTTLIVVGMTALPLLLVGSRLSELDAEEESAAGRIDAWIEGMGMLRHNPLFGVGYGNFTDYNELTAHNSLVLAFSELGLFGYTLWLAIIGYSGYMLYWLTFRSEAWAREQGRTIPENFAAEVTAARGLLVTALGFAFGAFFLSQSFKALIFLMCGLAMGRYMQVAALIGPLPRLRFLHHLKYWMAASVGSILFIYVFVKVAH